MLLRLLDGRADEIAPFGPGTVVVLDVLVSEQVLQHEPGMARSFADAAVGDHGRIGCGSRAAIELLQFFARLERAVLVAGLAPRDALRARDVSATLTGLRQSRRCQDLPRELLWAPHVHEHGGARVHGLLHFWKERANRQVRRVRLVGRSVRRWLL